MVYNEKQHNQTHGMVRATECLSNTMYRSRMEASTSPPPPPPQASDVFENYCSNSPLPEQKCRSNAPH